MGDLEDILIFGVNMNFISSNEVKKCIFYFFTSFDEIKVILTPNFAIHEINIFSLHSMK